MSATPAPGETWVLRPTPGDPFPPKATRPVVIREVRDGWIRYDIGSITDNRDRISTFTAVYRRAQA